MPLLLLLLPLLLTEAFRLPADGGTSFETRPALIRASVGACLHDQLIDR